MGKKPSAPAPASAKSPAQTQTKQNPKRTEDDDYVHVEPPAPATKAPAPAAAPAAATTPRAPKQKVDKFDKMLNKFKQDLKDEENLVSMQYGTKLFVAGALVCAIPAYLYFTPLFNLSLLVYGPAVAVIVAIGGFFMMKASLGVAIKAERDIVRKRNLPPTKKGTEIAKPRLQAGMEAIYWALFVNNALFLIASLLLAVFIVPPAVSFAFEGAEDSAEGPLTTIETALSESTLEKIWVAGCAISILVPSFVLSKGISIV